MRKTKMEFKENGKTYNTSLSKKIGTVVRARNDVSNFFREVEELFITEGKEFFVVKDHLKMRYGSCWDVGEGYQNLVSFQTITEVEADEWKKENTNY